jgi:hypothetical protein
MRKSEAACESATTIEDIYYEGISRVRYVWAASRL